MSKRHRNQKPSLIVPKLTKNSILEQNATIFFWILFGLITVFCAWYTFRGLSDAPLFDWDEARHGISAWEMLQSGNYLTHTYLGVLDYWNLKPPLAFWPIVMGFKIFGVNALGFRFFSALCLPLITVGAMLFLKRNSMSSAIVSGLLFTLVGVQFNHLFLHGDADAVFFFFTFFCLMCFCQAMVGSDLFLVPSGIFAAGAFLTKAAHAGLLIVILLISLFLLRSVRRFAFLRFLLLAVLPTSTPVLLWGIWRYQTDGYEFLSKMLFTDVFARVTSELEGNARGAGYYFREFSRAIGPMLFWVFVFICAGCLILYIVKRRNLAEEDKVIICVFSLAAALPIFAYTFGTTKLSWYVWPSAIGFCVLVGWLVGYLVKRHQSKLREKKDTTITDFTLIICVIAVMVGLASMPNHVLTQYYYDTSTILPVESIFSSLPESRSANYYVVNTSGEASELPQSWVLHGIFLGYHYHAGDIIDFIKVASKENDILLVQFSSDDDLNTLLFEYDLTLKIKGQNTAVIVNT